MDNFHLIPYKIVAVLAREHIIGALITLYPQLNANFSIPEAFEVGACWALGYLGSPDALTGWQHDAELTPRTRNPLDSFVFSAWDQPAEL